MFRPNRIALLMKKLELRTVHGKETFASGVPIGLSVVHLKMYSAKSSVRADSSASRGAADGEEAAAKLLLPTSVDIAIGDVIQVMSSHVEVVSIESRFNTRGVHDHNEIGASIRAAV